MQTQMNSLSLQSICELQLVFRSIYYKDVNTASYRNINPFDTIGVPATPLPPPLAHIWAQGTPKNHIEPRNEVSER